MGSRSFPREPFTHRLDCRAVPPRARRCYSGDFGRSLELELGRTRRGVVFPRAVPRAPRDSMSLGRFRLCVPASAFYLLAGGTGAAHGPSGRSASERKIRTWFPRRQPRGMRLAVRVESAGPAFLTVVVHFQVVGYLLAALAVTQHGRVQRMLKVEELHA